MHSDLALKMTADLFWTGLLVCLPVLAVTMAVGFAMSILQVVTQIQDMSFAFVPKLLAAGAALVAFGPWMLRTLCGFVVALWARSRRCSERHAVHRLAPRLGWITAVLLLATRIAAVLLLTPVLYAVKMPALRPAAARHRRVVRRWRCRSRPRRARCRCKTAALVGRWCARRRIGATMGVGVLLAFAGFALAGRLVDVQVGFGLAQVFDPRRSARIPILSAVFGLLARRVLLPRRRAPCAAARHRVQRRAFSAWRGRCRSPPRRSRWCGGRRPVHARVRAGRAAGAGAAAGGVRARRDRAQPAADEHAGRSACR